MTCKECHCRDDEAHKYSECFCLCHTPQTSPEKDAALAEWHQQRFLEANKRQRGFIDGRMFTAMIWFFLLAGVAIGATLFVLIPWLWRLVKPWIHSITS